MPEMVIINGYRYRPEDIPEKAKAPANKATSPKNKGVGNAGNQSSGKRGKASPSAKSS